jgi:hypothetical protein
MRALAGLWLTWLVKLGVTTTAALYPLRGSLWRLQHFQDLAQLYSLANSNLDVWLLALTHTAVVGMLLSRVAAPRRRFSGLVIPPPYTKARQQLRGHGSSVHSA